MTGRCLCGAVTYTAREVDRHVHACHCGICRRWTGGPALTAIVADVTFVGDEHIKTYASSDFADRGFCSTCGSNLFFRTKDGSMMVVWSGTLDDQSELVLSGEIYIDQKSPGYDFAGDHPRQTEAEFLASIGQSQT